MGASEEESIKEGIPTYAYNMLAPQHKVSVKAFAIAKFDVTKAEFAAFARETGFTFQGCKTYKDHLLIGPDGYWFQQNASWRNPGFSQTDRDPVVCVSWDDAQRYLAWLNAKLQRQHASSTSGAPRYRLPTEAEWEYAARAGTTTSRFWGNDASEQCHFANAADMTAKERYPGWDAANCRDGYVTTAPVGSFRPNPWGLFDMLGNVAQWIEDCWHFDYNGAPVDGSAWTTGKCEMHEARGGSWSSIPRGILSSARYQSSFDLRESNLGFRVARDLP